MKKEYKFSPEGRRNIAFSRLGLPLSPEHKEHIREGVARAQQEGRYHPGCLRKCDKIPKQKSRPATIEALTTACNNPSGDPEGLDIDFIESQVQQLHRRRSA